MSAIETWLENLKSDDIDKWKNKLRDVVDVCIQENDVNTLKGILSSPHFMSQRVQVHGLEALIKDMEAAIVFTDSEALRHIHEVLSTKADVLSKRPDEINAQFWAYLQDQDIPRIQHMLTEIRERSTRKETGKYFIRPLQSMRKQKKQKSQPLLRDIDVGFLVRTMALTPDGSQVLVAGRNSRIQFRNTKTGEIIRSLATKFQDIDKTHYQNDGSLEITNFNQGLIVKVESKTGNVLGVSYEPNPEYQKRLEWAQKEIKYDEPSPYRSHMENVEAHNRFKDFWRQQLEQIPKSLSLINIASHEGGLRILAVNGLERPKYIVAYGKKLEQVHVAEMPHHYVRLKGIASWASYSNNDYAYAFSWNNPYAKDDEPYRAINICVNGKIHQLIPSNEYPAVDYLSFSDDGQRFYVAMANIIDIWDISSFQRIATLNPERIYSTYNSGETCSMSVSRNNKYLAVGSAAGCVTVWDLKRQTIAAHYKGHTEAVHAVVFMPDCSAVISGSFDQTVKIWKTNDFTSNESTVKTS